MAAREGDSSTVLEKVRSHRISNDAPFDSGHATTVPAIAHLPPLLVLIGCLINYQIQISQLIPSPATLMLLALRTLMTDVLPVL